MGKLAFHRTIRTLVFGLAIAAPSLIYPAPARARDYLVAVTNPNSIHLIDARTREVVRSIPIPGQGAPITVSILPKGTVAYVLTNHLGSISGIDLTTGKQVFRADMGGANIGSGDARVRTNIRVRTNSALTVGANGKEVFVLQSRVRLLPAEYQVLDSRIAVYDTSAGTNAKPVRTFPAPRGIFQLIPSPDGKRLYAYGYDYYTLDPKTGERLDTFKVRGWTRPNMGKPDILNMWLAYETTGIYVAGYVAPRTDMDLSNPQAWVSGLLIQDLASGKVRLVDYERGGPITFTFALNPAHRNEVFGVYLQLSKIDIDKAKVVQRIPLEHTYYSLNIASDGSEVYLGGTMNDIAIYGTEKLDHRGNILLPGGGDQGLGFLRLVQWDDE